MNYGFIGCGHMGSELARIVAKSGEKIALANRTLSKAEALAKETGGKVLSSAEICESAKYIYIGVRPQDLNTLSEEIKGVLASRKDRFIIVTMLAGKTIKQVKEALGVDAPIIKIMPNTPIKVGAGVILYSKDDKITEAEEEFFKTSLSASGEIIEIDEKLMNAGGVVSGSGPAYVYKFLLAFAKAGEALGFDAETSMKLVCETAVGSAKMVLESGKSAETLCGEVCSKGGSTEQGVFKIDASDLDEIFDSACKASYNRTLEMGK